MNVVSRFEPFTVATELETKFWPFTMTEAAEDPASTLVGVSDVICGTGAVLGVTVSVSKAEVPPPGAGVNTATEIVPGKGISLGLTVVLSSLCPNWSKIVGRGDPLNSIRELGANPVPFTTSVN